MKGYPVDVTESEIGSGEDMGLVFIDRQRRTGAARGVVDLGDGDDACDFDCTAERGRSAVVVETSP